MPHGVTRDNWYSMATAAVERVRAAAATAAPGSFEEQALILEACRIGEMMRAIEDDDPDARPEFRSHLLAVHVRESLRVSEELLEFVGAVAEVYRRWRRQLRTAS